MQRTLQGVNGGASEIAEESQDMRFYLPDRWPTERLPSITQLILGEVEAQWPPFVDEWYGKRYREFALDPDWLARSFLANANKEAEGARKLWKIAGEAREFPFSEAIEAHAVDEAQHARMYISMLDLVFPGALLPSDAEAVLSDYPIYIGERSPHNIPGRDLVSLLDDIVQMNIGEVRTRIHQMLLMPVAVAVAPPENHARLSAILMGIYTDEGRHILYTSEILETYFAAGLGAEIKDLYTRRLRDFSELTVQEVGVGNFD
jgi:hypothetical protein